MGKKIKKMNIILIFIYIFSIQLNFNKLGGTILYYFVIFIWKLNFFYYVLQYFYKWISIFLLIQKFMNAKI